MTRASRDAHEAALLHLPSVVGAGPPRRPSPARVCGIGLSDVLTDPLLVLRVAGDTADASVRPEASAPEALITDLHILGAVARRAHRRLQDGGGLLPPERARAWRLFDQVHTDFHDLQRRCEKKLRDARSGTAHGDCERTGQGPRDPPDRPGLADLPGGGPDGAHSGQLTGATD